jgi:outer membrane protein TolC
MVQPHVAGTELLTLVSTQQQILALEMELTVKAAETVQRAQIDLVEAQRTPDVNVDLLYHGLSNAEDAFDVGVRLPLHFFDRGQGRLQKSATPSPSVSRPPTES